MALEPMPQPWAEALLQAYATDNRTTEFLLEQIGDEAWRTKPPAGRSIAAIVAHMHNVRVRWLKAARAETVPAQLDRHTVTGGESADLPRATMGAGASLVRQPAAAEIGFLWLHRGGLPEDPPVRSSAGCCR